MGFDVDADDNASRVFDRVADTAERMGARLAAVSLIGAKVALGAGLASALPQILGLVTAIASTAPAAAIAVPALFGVVGAIAALKLATSGVAEAFEAAASGDAEKLAEALGKLTPAARGFVKEGIALIPQLRALKQAVQEQFFEAFSGDLTRVADNLLPRISAGLHGIIGPLGDAVHQMGVFLSGGEAGELLSSIFSSVNRALEKLVLAPAKVTRAFLQIGKAAGPGLERVAGGLAGMIDRFADGVDRVTKSGALGRWIDNALDTLGTLGRILGNVTRAIAGLFGAADGGQTLLDTIERITAAIAGFVNSERGQQILQRVFDVLSRVGPVVAGVAAVVSIVTALGSVLSMVATPVGAVVAVLAVLGAVAYLAYTRIAPLRQAVDATARVLGGAAVGAVRDLANWIRTDLIPMSEQIGQKVSPIVRHLGQMWTQHVVPAMQRVADFVRGQLRQVFDQISASIRGQVMPAIDRLTAAYQRNKPQIDQIVRGGARMVEGFAKVAAVLGGATARAVIAFAGGALMALIDGVSMAIQLISDLTRILNRVVGAAKAAGQAIRGALSNLPSLPSFGIPFLASGGPITGPAIVGERGPELFVPGVAGRIIPNHALGGIGGAINLTVNLVAPDGKVLQQQLLRIKARNGGAALGLA